MVDKKALRNISFLMMGLMILLVLFVTGNDSLISLLAVYIGMLFISITIYRTKDTKLRDNLFGLSRKNLGRSLVWALILGVGFYLVTKLIPGASIGLPVLPQSIGTGLRNFIVLFLAPVVESVFFQSVVYAFLLASTGNKGVAFFGQATTFSLAHVAAYVTGFYQYPTFVAGLSAFSANIGAFVAAFIFASVAMAVQLRPKIRNLAFTIVFHLLLNLIILTALALIIVNV